MRLTLPLAASSSTPRPSAPRTVPAMGAMATSLPARGARKTTKSRDKLAIAQDLAEKVLKEFGQQEGEINYVRRAPKKRQEIWRKLGVVPRGMDIEVVELMHRTHMGVDQEYHNLIKQSTRCALADGWAGSMISTDLQDIMFGCPGPSPARSIWEC